MTVLEALGREIAAFNSGTLSNVAIERSRAAVMDTVGVALGGANEAACRIQREISRPQAAGGSLLFGTDIRTDPLLATLVNGTAAHVLDYDDGNSVIAGHPSAMLVPALIALAEDRGKSGQDLLVAYVIGMETMTAIARGINPYHYEKGWHPTSTVGIFGTAAACASLLGLDAQRSAMALAICASMASGIKVNFGTMTKALHAGHGGRNGLYAALLAERGFTANPAALEGEQGFLDVYNGVGACEEAAIRQEWSPPYAIESSGLTKKLYPCCGSTIPAAAAAATIVREHTPPPDDIASIEILTHRRRLPHTDRPNLVSALAAKFSIQYVVARMLVQGDLSLTDFAGDAHLDPVVLGLMKRTVVGVDPLIAENESDQFLCRVIITMRNGKRFSARRSRPHASPELLRSKFIDCARKVFSADRIHAVIAALEGLERLSQIRELTGLLKVSTELPNSRSPLDECGGSQRDEGIC